jgi:hypothetical protein
MNEISQFEVPCRYREEGMYCSDGHIYVMEPGSSMASLGKFGCGGDPVPCPACGGTGFVLTPAGKQLVEMMKRYFTPYRDCA